MSRPVTREEWNQYKARQLAPDEMLDVSRRLKQFGLEVGAPESDATTTLLRLTDQDGFSDAELALYAEGKASAELTAEIDGAREVDAVLEQSLAARERALREVAASREMEPAPVDKRPKLALWVNASGWVAAAACLTALMTVVPRQSQTIAERDRTISSLRGQVSSGQSQGLSWQDLIGDVPRYATVPPGTRYESGAARVIFSCLPSEAAVQALETGRVQVSEHVTRMPLELGTGMSEVRPSRTDVGPAEVARLTWTHTSDGPFHVTMTGPDGETVTDKDGVQGGEVFFEEPLTRPGVYTWEVRTSGSVSKGSFGVVTNEQSRAAVLTVLENADPVSRAVALAELGFRQQAYDLMSTVASKNPSDPKLQDLVKALAPSR